MFRRHTLIPSASMERRMHLWRFGHFGAPVIVFPSAAGMAHEWDAQGMVEALSDLIEGGRIKLYCTESNVAEAWTRKENDPAWRIRRHVRYEQYILDDLVPFIREDCRSAGIPIGATGCSLGGFYSANFALKHPQTFNYALCMSGRYDTSDLNRGYSSPDTYYNNPMAYVPGLNGDDLNDVRRHTHLALVCGRGPWEDGNYQETEKFANVLAEKGIRHTLDLWGHDVAHGWAWWQRQARFHLGNTFGG